jgi:hypothetical protein
MMPARTGRVWGFALAVLCVWATSAPAAILDSVRVITPESGRVIGIDSVITAEAFFRTTGPDSNVRVLFWLNSTSTHRVVRDTTRNTRELLDSIRTAALGSADSVLSSDVRTDTGFVAAGRSLYRAASNIVGDADTMVVGNGPVTASGYSWKVTWKYRVHASVGEVSNVTVWASVRDSLGTPRTFALPQSAKRSWLANLDGDRPEIPPGAFLLPINTRGGVLVSGFGVLGDSTRTVLSLGDTVNVRYDLGLRADSTILSNNLSVICRFAYGSTTSAIDLGLIRRRVDSVYVPITSLQFGSTFARIDSSSRFGSVEMFLRENASGNISSFTGDALLVPGKDDVVPVPITTAASFVLDAVAPVIDGGIVDGDTLLPASGGKISRGAIRPTAARDTALPWASDDPTNATYAAVKNAFTLAPGEDLYGVQITAEGGGHTYVWTVAKSLRHFRFGGVLVAGQSYCGDLSNAAGPLGAAYIWARVAGNRTGYASITEADSTALSDGVYTLRVQAEDLAGNLGPELVRTNVYVDITPLTLARMFPAKGAFGPVTAARVDTIEETTSPVRFALSEPADSVVIRYTAIAGKDTTGKIRTRKLSGDELTNTTLGRYAIEGLIDSTTYALTVVARDLAGNYTISGPDTLCYDTSYVVPLIKRFRVEVNAAKMGIGAARQNTVGDTVIINLTADASLDGHRDAVTYEGLATLTIGGGGGVTLAGSGVTQVARNKVSLSTDGWSAGRRQVVLLDTVGYDSLQVSISDTTLSGVQYTGALDSLLVYQPDEYAAIVVTAPDTVSAGTSFMVNARLVDRFRNTRVFDKRFLVISTNKLGIEIPQGPVWVRNGVASFPTTASVPMTGLTYRLTDFVEVNADYWRQGLGEQQQRQGLSNPVTVVPRAIPTLDAPDTLVVQDYKGADGLGDQGGFVTVTFPVSTDHATLTRYRIYRSVVVSVGTDGTGLTALSSPSPVMMPWAVVDAVPGESIVRVVVATLDNVPSHWGVAAERVPMAAAQAALSAPGPNPTTAYQLLATAVVASRDSSPKAADPIFATLTPDAVALAMHGVAPSLKTVAEAEVSAMTRTAAAVRAVDDIAPLAVQRFQAKDTPADAGASVTVTWDKSPSDMPIQRFAGAAGSAGFVGDVVPGVVGYNIYRRTPGAAYERVGQAPAGETAYADLGVMNGIRYTYRIQPYDEDNEPVSTLERTAMAIRNQAVDGQGQPLYGLFGSDNTVGFDDFFLFADAFGSTSADEAWEPAFDLAPSERVDFEDFFVFADNFGRSTGPPGLARPVPVACGINGSASLALDTGPQLPGAGDDLPIAVRLSGCTEMKGYGVTLRYDAGKLHYVGIADASSVLAGGGLSAVHALSESPGTVSFAAYGATARSGTQVVNVLFRTKDEIESSFVEVSQSTVVDALGLLNEVPLPPPAVIQTRPTTYGLGSNYPNPFNPDTAIKYALPEAAAVRLEVFNQLGQLVRTLVTGPQSPGRYTVLWDATDDQGAAVSSGIYIYQLRAENRSVGTRKMLLLK